MCIICIRSEGGAEEILGLGLMQPYDYNGYYDYKMLLRHLWCMLQIPCLKNTVKMLQSREEGGAEGRLDRWILELVTAISLRG